MTEKTFLLGVGAQKCGTSWLHDLIEKSPEADMGLCKEYHIHDCLTLTDGVDLKARILRQRDDLREQGPTSSFHKKLFLRAEFLADPSTYYAYFKERLTAPSKTLTGDFTPSYSGLNTKTLTEINKQMLAHGLRTRVVFLMRDPVERAWSAIRMVRRRKLENYPNYVFKIDEFEHLRKTYKNPIFELRGDYIKTLARLDQVFDSDHLFIEFYEQLFSQKVVDRFCTFSGISRIDADLGKRVNSSPKSLPIPEDIGLMIARHYSEIYFSLAKRYGEDMIKELWWSSRFVL